MTSKPYGTICALSKACEIVEPRWTLPILNQMWNGYSRFSDIRRAVGNISPGVLSNRLAEMEKAGLVERVADRAKNTVDYIRTARAIGLEPMMDALAMWAQRNIDAEIALADGNLSRLMWSFGKLINISALPARRIVMRLHFSDEKGQFPVYWLISEPGTEPELCVLVPDLDVDLYIETTKVSWGAIFYGRSTIAREIDAGRLFLTGDALMVRTMDQWMPRSVYAGVEGIRMLPAAE